MDKAVSALLAAVAVIHLLPLSGVLGAERLTALYGISFADPDLLIMMRHRAVLFGLLGAFLLYAAFKPALQPLAFVAGFVSTVSFLWLAKSVGGYGASLSRVVIADVVAVACLIVAAALFLLQQRAAVSA